MRPQHPQTEGEAASSHQVRVALFVVSTLLAAALIVIYRLSVANVQISNRSFKTLRDENEALRRNLTAFIGSNITCSMLENMCPKSSNISHTSCLRCEGDWEFYGGKCYLFSNNRSPWNQSREECRCLGGDLVMIDSREEQIFLDLRMMDKMKEDEDKFWIGLTDMDQEGTWLWVDGSKLNDSLTFWRSGQPDNWRGWVPEGEDCARMGQIGGAKGHKTWFDSYCMRSHRRICEKNAETGHPMYQKN